MWGVFELIYQAFKNSGIDFMDGSVIFFMSVLAFWLISVTKELFASLEMLPALDNYISYGRDVFVANENIQRMMFDIVETVCNVYSCLSGWS